MDYKRSTLKSGSILENERSPSWSHNGLDFLGLEDTYSERDLEAAILRELERFLLELGTDFSFIARQKRMTIGERDFYLDLLFYHRGLRRLLAIELKLGSFDAAL